MKVLKVEVKVILKRVLVVFLLKLCLKLIASEASEEKNEKKMRFRHKKNHRSAAVRGGARRVRPPPLDPLVYKDTRSINRTQNGTPNYPPAMVDRIISLIL